mgnify:CR=1 FL=1
MIDNRQDELELLKAQMQVLTSKLQKSEIISEEMIRVRNLGKKSLEEVIAKLHSLGLELKREED